MLLYNAVIVYIIELWCTWKDWRVPNKPAAQETAESNV